MDYQGFVKQVLAKALPIAKKNFGKVNGTIKGKDTNQILTQTDQEIGSLIVDQVAKFFPDHNILDEEIGIVDKQSQFTWVIDPIDGTSNFAAGMPTYCIMVGLLKESIPIISAISLPEFNQLYLAEKGSGAFMNDQRVHVTDQEELINVLVSYAIDGHQENPKLTHNETKLLAEIILKIRNFRSNGSNYDALLVARGVLGAWLNQTSKIWDNVAPHLIIEEAGGLYTDFFGRPIDYSRPLTKVKDNFTACAAAPSLHRQLQAIIHATH